MKLTDLLDLFEPEYETDVRNSFYMSNINEHGESLYKTSINRGRDIVNFPDDNDYRIIFSPYGGISSQNKIVRVLFNYRKTDTKYLNNVQYTIFTSHKKIDTTHTENDVTDNHVNNLNLKIINFYIQENLLSELLKLAIEKEKLTDLLKEIIRLDAITPENNFLLKLLQVAEESDSLLNLVKADNRLNKKYEQLIVYGPAGVGKTYGIKQKAIDELKITEDNYEKQTIHTVFHPEYSYYDFFGKVMPTKKEDGQISYTFLPGPFIQALNLAYKNILENPINPEKVLLVIDELNRGNAASIFGGLLNLLDRNEYGISEYPLNIYGMEAQWLKEKMLNAYNFEILEAYSKKVNFTMNDGNNDSLKIYIPNNLSIICTMNTSDQTIFSLDKAFQRRFNKHFLTAENSLETYNENVNIENNNNNNNISWKVFLTKLNTFIKTYAEVDDVDNATIGAYFVKAKTVEGGKKVILEEDIKYTVMYYLWYDLFNGWKRESLLNNLGEEFKQLKTFEEFVKNYTSFINKIVENSATDVVESETTEEIQS